MIECGYAVAATVVTGMTSATGLLVVAGGTVAVTVIVGDWGNT